MNKKSKIALASGLTVLAGASIPIIYKAANPPTPIYANPEAIQIDNQVTTDNENHVAGVISVDNFDLNSIQPDYGFNITYNSLMPPVLKVYYTDTDYYKFYPSQTYNADKSESVAMFYFKNIINTFERDEKALSDIKKFTIEDNGFPLTIISMTAEECDLNGVQTVAIEASPNKPVFYVGDSIKNTDFTVIETLSNDLTQEAPSNSFTIQDISVTEPGVYDIEISKVNMPEMKTIVSVTFEEKQIDDIYTSTDETGNINLTENSYLIPKDNLTMLTNEGSLYFTFESLAADSSFGLTTSNDEGTTIELTNFAITENQTVSIFDLKDLTEEQLTAISTNGITLSGTNVSISNIQYYEKTDQLPEKTYKGNRLELVDSGKVYDSLAKIAKEDFILTEFYDTGAENVEDFELDITDIEPYSVSAKYIDKVSESIPITLQLTDTPIISNIVVPEETCFGKNLTTVDVTIKSKDTTSPVSIEYNIDNKAWYEAASNITVSEEGTTQTVNIPTASLLFGSHTLTIKVINAAGSSQVTRTFTQVDKNIQPQITFINPLEDIPYTDSEYKMDVNLDISAEGNPPLKVTSDIDLSVVGDVVYNDDGTYTISFDTRGLSVGKHEMVISVVDTSLINNTVPYTYRYNFNVTNEPVTLNSVSIQEQLGDILYADIDFKDPNKSQDIMVQYSFDGDSEKAFLPFITSTGEDQTARIALDIENICDGEHTLHIYLTDPDGYKSSQSIDFEKTPNQIILDEIPEMLFNGNTYNFDMSGSIVGFESASEIKNIKILVNGNRIPDSQITYKINADKTINCNVTVNDKMTVGDNEVVVTVHNNKKAASGLATVKLTNNPISVDVTDKILRAPTDEYIEFPITITDKDIGQPITITTQFGTSEAETETVISTGEAITITKKYTKEQLDALSGTLNTIYISVSDGADAKHESVKVYTYKNSSNLTFSEGSIDKDNPIKDIYTDKDEEIKIPVILDTEIVPSENTDVTVTIGGSTIPDTKLEMDENNKPVVVIPNDYNVPSGKQDIVISVENNGNVSFIEDSIVIEDDTQDPSRLKFEWSEESYSKENFTPTMNTDSQSIVITLPIPPDFNKETLQPKIAASNGYEVKSTQSINKNTDTIILTVSKKDVSEGKYFVTLTDGTKNGYDNIVITDKQISTNGYVPSTSNPSNGDNSSEDVTDNTAPEVYIYSIDETATYGKGVTAIVKVFDEDTDQKIKLYYKVDNGEKIYVDKFTSDGKNHTFEVTLPSELNIGEHKVIFWAEDSEKESSSEDPEYIDVTTTNDSGNAAKFNIVNSAPELELTNIDSDIQADTDFMLTFKVKDADPDENIKLYYTINNSEATKLDEFLSYGSSKEIKELIPGLPAGSYNIYIWAEDSRKQTSDAVKIPLTIREQTSTSKELTDAKFITNKIKATSNGNEYINFDLYIKAPKGETLTLVYSLNGKSYIGPTFLVANDEEEQTLTINNIEKGTYNIDIWLTDEEGFSSKGISDVVVEAIEMNGIQDDSIYNVLDDSFVPDVEISPAPIDPATGDIPNSISTTTPTITTTTVTEPDANKIVEQKPVSVVVTGVETEAPKLSKAPIIIGITAIIGAGAAFFVRWRKKKTKKDKK